MSELLLLEETVADLFERELAAEATLASLWQTLEESGLTLAGVPEASGGSGGGVDEAAVVVRLAGRFAAPGPIAETALLAGPLLAAAGLEVPPGPLTVASAATLSIRDGVLSGSAARVPWASFAEHIVVLADGRVACVPVSAAVLTPGANMAGEPRDELSFDDVAVDARPSALDAADLRRRGARARSLALAGALERVLELTIRYATEREQFGRSLGHFQVIQQQIAVLAGEVAAARGAVDAAVDRGDLVSIAAAKLRAGDAAGRAAAIAHQVHGAIGFTDEHELHRTTLRLWSWRDEFGSEQEWAVEIGNAVAAVGADGLWPLLAD